MFNRIEIPCPALEEIGRRFRAVAEFYSVLFRPATPKHFGHDFQAGFLEMLKENRLEQAVPKLLPLSYSAASKFAVLNKYEFEGSLISAFLQGTCTDRVVADEREAYEVVRTIMKSLLLRPNGSILAIRMDDPSWSALSNAATLSWAYFVYESSQQIWWFVCFADYY